MLDNHKWIKIPRHPEFLGLTSWNVNSYSIRGSSCRDFNFSLLMGDFRYFTVNGMFRDISKSPNYKGNKFNKHNT